MTLLETKTKKNKASSLKIFPSGKAQGPTYLISVYSTGRRDFPCLSRTISIGILEKIRMPGPRTVGISEGRARVCKIPETKDCHLSSWRQRMKTQGRLSTAAEQVSAAKGLMLNHPLWDSCPLSVHICILWAGHNVWPHYTRKMCSPRSESNQVGCSFSLPSAP